MKRCDACRVYVGGHTVIAPELISSVGQVVQRDVVLLCEFSDPQIIGIRVWPSSADDLHETTRQEEQPARMKLVEGLLA